MSVREYVDTSHTMMDEQLMIYIRPYFLPLTCRYPYQHNLYTLRLALASLTQIKTGRV